LERILLVTVGVVIGLAAVAGLTRLVQAQLYGLSAHDPLTLAMAALTLAAVACAAGYIPAIRAVEWMR
jgi:ABC-type antimicrobial peptide transport system permease subunit